MGGPPEGKGGAQGALDVYVADLDEGLISPGPPGAVEPYVVERYPPVLLLRARDGRFGLRVDGVRLLGRADFLWLGERALYISRRHALVRRAGGSFYLEDLGSLNGTFLNGVDVRGRGPVELRPGDVVGLAGVVELVASLLEGEE